MFLKFTQNQTELFYCFDIVYSVITWVCSPLPQYGAFSMEIK